MAQNDPAAGRFWAIQAIRISGVILAVLGALILGEIIDLPTEVGYVFLVLGALDVFVMPLVLARRWNSSR
ncbi:MAG: hypothetical protein R3E14_03465 [Erythrobacter sp.]